MLNHRGLLFLFFVVGIFFADKFNSPLRPEIGRNILKTDIVEEGESA